MKALHLGGLALLPFLAQMPLQASPQHGGQPATLFSSWLASQQQTLAAADCISQSCPRQQHEFSPALLPGLQRQQTILLLDTGGMDFLAALPYRQRIKSVWHFSTPAAVSDDEPPVAQWLPRSFSVELPAYLLQYYQSFWQLQRQLPVTVSAVDLQPLFRPLLQPDPLVSLPYSGHGSVALGYLAEHNPQAELVLATMPDFPAQFSAEFCAADVTAYRDKVAQASQQFKWRVLRGESVEWINMAAGWDLERSIHSSARRLCAQPLSATQAADLLAAQQPFYDVLFNSHGVLAVQAGVANFDGVQHALDAIAYRHRVRAGFFNTGQALSQLDGYGRLPAGVSAPVLPAYQQNSLAVLDVLVNFSFSGTGRRCVPGTFAMRIPSDFGAGYDALCSQQTSWAAPVVLSQLLYLREHEFAGWPWDNSLIAALKARLTPPWCPAAGSVDNRCKLQDPLLNQQHLWLHSADPR